MGKGVVFYRGQIACGISHFLTRADFKNEWSCNSSPSIGLIHVNRQTLKFFQFLCKFPVVRKFWCKFDPRNTFYFGNSKIIARK
jgi:hypothetical protein